MMFLKRINGKDFQWLPDHCCWPIYCTNSFIWAALQSQCQTAADILDTERWLNKIFGLDLRKLHHEHRCHERNLCCLHILWPFKTAIWPLRLTKTKTLHPWLPFCGGENLILWGVVVQKVEYQESKTEWRLRLPLDIYSQEVTRMQAGRLSARCVPVTGRGERVKSIETLHSWCLP